MRDTNEKDGAALRVEKTLLFGTEKWAALGVGTIPGN